ncbi:hypothetical protein ACLQ3C_07085 [Gordonia sp. DT30]|uniref:hypothetical protein n=1 Tax=Gordonia sp. DT30 TaxID=3416546 RepID=UPI003CF3D32F
MHALTSPEVTATRTRRPRVTTGLALAGAAAIAITPLAMTGAPALAADVNHATSAAATTGIGMYQQVIADTIANIQKLQKSAPDGTLPILNQILSNQQANLSGLGSALGTFGPKALDALQTEVPPLLEEAAAALADGDLATAINSVVLAAILPVTAGLDMLPGPILPALQKVLAGPLENLANVINETQNQLILSAVLVPVSPLLGGMGGLVQGIQNVIDAAKTGDPAATLNALVAAPAVMLDGLLNGGYGIDLAPVAGLGGIGLKVVAGGIFGNTEFGDDGVLTLPGSVSSWQSLQKGILKIITPPKTTSATSSVAVKSISPTDISAVTSPRATSVTVGATTSTAGSASATESSATASAPATAEPTTSTPTTSTPSTSTPSTSTPSTSTPSTSTPTTGSSEAPTAPSSAPEATGGDSATSAESANGSDATGSGSAGSSDTGSAGTSSAGTSSAGAGATSTDSSTASSSSSASSSTGGSSGSQGSSDS